MYFQVPNESDNLNSSEEKEKEKRNYQSHENRRIAEIREHVSVTCSMF